MIFRSLFIIMLLCLVSSITNLSCTYDHQEGIICTGTPEVVSFHSNVLPIFRSKCSTVLCHSGIEPTGNLNLEDAQAYDALSRVGSGYLNTDDPNHSILYTQLNSLSLPMPPEGKLDQCSIELILKWLEQGAVDN